MVLVFPKGLSESNETKAVLLTSAPQGPQAITGQHGTGGGKTRLPRGSAAVVAASIFPKAVTTPESNALTSWQSLNTSGSCVWPKSRGSLPGIHRRQDAEEKPLEPVLRDDHTLMSRGWLLSRDAVILQPIIITAAKQRS